MDEIVEKLKEIGLNEYQSKVYIALLKKFPATGYEISKLANIPQSRAYDTLKTLESMHIAIPSNTKPITYTPIKPKELTKRYKRKIDSTINFLEKKLPNIKEEEYTEPILSISGRTKILDKIIEIIKNAQKTIFISLWAQDTCNFGKTFQHSGIPMLEHYFNGKFVFLAADNSEGLFGITQPVKNTNPEVVWTKNSEIVFLIKAFTVHDMYMIDIEDNFPEQLRYFYGAGLKKLRDKILH